MASARQLYELQQLELEAQQRQQVLQRAQVLLQDTRERDEAREQAAAAATRHQVLRTDLRDAELALQQLVKRIQDTERSLYSGRTTNPKELVSLQEDLSMLQRQRQTQETQLLELMGQAEEAETNAAGATERAKEAEAAWESQKARLLQEQEQAAQELGAFQERAEQAAAALNGQELVLYQSLKKARAGVAVARVERGICRGCGLTVPSRDVQRARASHELVRCTSCGRILYAV